MKNPFIARATSLQAAVLKATLRRSFGPMRRATETIRRALAATRPVKAAVKDAVRTTQKTATAAASARLQERSVKPAAPLLGSVETQQFTNSAGTRAYKVYVPVGKSKSPRAMVVMLHGCKQSVDDFATGTRMNRLADVHGFLVLYPEQSAQANASKCWNWFQPQDQLRGDGEPSLVAGITREVAGKYGVDPLRIFVAGLSAGAAMAVVLGETYPEIFAGVGAHSGLPYGGAHDLGTALLAMKGGRSGIPGLRKLSVWTPASGRSAKQAVPVIVFHGDRDHTVQQSNSNLVVQQARDAHAAQPGEGELRVGTKFGVSPGGRRFSREVHTDSEGQARIENWTLHGAGHAWSGGHASGSYTDGAGPDASAEMVRFFMDLPRADTA